ncbi:hypothetical protein J4227_07000 [Candidatus Woesearchaeota archaeon]|nr:hypothetical protein [Candidatus Woesearchaeota archaeon]
MAVDLRKLQNAAKNRNPEDLLISHYALIIANPYNLIAPSGKIAYSYRNEIKQRWAEKIIILSQYLRRLHGEIVEQLSAGEEAYRGMPINSEFDLMTNMMQNRSDEAVDASKKMWEKHIEPLIPLRERKTGNINYDRLYDKLLGILKQDYSLNDLQKARREFTLMASLWRKTVDKNWSKGESYEKWNREFNGYRDAGAPESVLFVRKNRNRSFPILAEYIRLKSRESTLKKVLSRIYTAMHAAGYRGEDTTFDPAVFAQEYKIHRDTFGILVVQPDEAEQLVSKFEKRVVKLDMDQRYRRWDKLDFETGKIGGEARGGYKEYFVRVNKKFGGLQGREKKIVRDEAIQVQFYPYIRWWLNNFLRTEDTHKTYKQIQANTVDEAVQDDDWLSESQDGLEEMLADVQKIIRESVPLGSPLLHAFSSCVGAGPEASKHK